MWVEMGIGSASGGGISNNSGLSKQPSAVGEPGGTVYVAWHDATSGNREIYVRRWNGSGWIEAGSGSANGGGISNNSGASFAASVAVAPDGTLYVAWHDASAGDREIYVRRWDGVDLGEVGTGSATGGGISDKAGTRATPHWPLPQMALPT